MQSENNNAPRSISRDSIFGSLAVACLWAWSYISFFSPVILLPFDKNLKIEPIFRVCCFASIALTFAISVFLRKKLTTQKGIAALTALSTICAPWASIIVLTCKSFSDSLFVISCIAWCLSGIAIAILMLLACKFPIADTSINAIVSTSISVIIGAVIYLAVTLLPSNYGVIATLTLPYFSLLFLVLGNFVKYFKFVPQAEYPTKSVIIDAFNLQPSQIINGVIFGFSIGFAITVLTMNGNQLRPSLTVAICLAGPIALLMGLLVSHMPNLIERIKLLQLPICASLFSTLILRYPGTEFPLVCASILAFVCTFYDIIHDADISELSKDDTSRTPILFAGCKFYTYIGIAAGWGLMTLLHRTTGFTSNEFYDVIFFIIVVSFFGISYISIALTKELNTPSMQVENAITEDDAMKRTKLLKKFAKEHELTERQTEVFEYLAKGRNTSYISEKLVLSTHTVKAHMYRIYQKLDIHSQQDLTWTPNSGQP